MGSDITKHNRKTKCNYDKSRNKKIHGVLGGTQTHDLQDRNLLLYSAELRTHISGVILDKTT